MGRQYEASYMLSARAEDGEVRSLVAGGAVTIIRADRRRPVERASKGPDLLLNAKDTSNLAKCLKPGWKSKEEIGGHGGCPVEGQWHGKLGSRQVLRDPGWTCVLFVKTGGANQDIFIRVMFDTIREQSVVLHSVAGAEGQRWTDVGEPSGRRPEVQQLRVRGTSPGLEGTQRLDQGPRCELHDTIGAAGHARGRERGVPGDRLV